MKKIKSFLDDPELAKLYDKRTMESIDYLKSRNWKAMSNEVPDEILGWWVSEWSADENGNMRYAEPVIENHANLSVFSKVFMRDMIERLYLNPEYFDKEYDADPDFIYNASKLVRYVWSMRKEGRKLPDFDMFDIERYDEIKEMLRK